MLNAVGSVKPRLHDTTCCQTGCSCLVYTNIQPVPFDNRFNERKPVERRVAVRSTVCTTGFTTGLTTGCIVQTNLQPVWQPVGRFFTRYNRLYNKPVVQPVVSCKRGITTNTGSRGSTQAYLRNLERMYYLLRRVVLRTYGEETSRGTRRTWLLTGWWFFKQVNCWHFLYAR